MAACVNKVILIGYLGSDPELRATPNGANVATSITGGTATRWQLQASQPLYNPQRRAQQQQLRLQADMADLIKASAPASEPVLYTVKKGDNLWKVAESHYGKGKGAKHVLIFDANRPMLSHPDKIYPGQVLRIPDVAEA